jgi:dTDP-4-dehydrorhamnose 3,5-epimerase
VRVVPTELPDVLVIEPDVIRDSRGFFVEIYHAERYRQHGIAASFVQDNHSQSVGGTVRGLHLQVRHVQGKLIRVIEGEIFDVAVDVRRGSPTFGKWVGVLLSAENFKQCYLPPGLAHGFAVVSPTAQVEYKCTDVYDRASEIGIAWDDPALGIEWPVTTPILSDRDRRNPKLAELIDQLPRFKSLDIRSPTPSSDTNSDPE